MGVPQNIMRALCAVIRPDHFKFASYGPAVRNIQAGSEPTWYQFSVLNWLRNVIKSI